MKKLVIDHTNENQRIDKYLKKLLVKAPASMIYKMLRKKDVKVNGVKVKENYIVKYGDVVELFLYDDKFQEYTAPMTIHDLAITFKTAYEDEHLLVANKPAGLLVQPDTKDDFDTLSYQVLSYLRQKGDYDPALAQGFTPGPVHRLDRNTSGLVMFGKDMRALQDLNEMMKKRHCIDKKYLTIVKGYMKDCELIDYVKKNEAEGKMYLVKENTPGALKMHTVVHVIKARPQYSLVEVSLITGRTHQIRVHLASTGHPVMGDAKYGDFEWNKAIKKKYHLNSQLLHAYSLTFVRPIGSLKYMQGKTITAPLPPLFKKIKKDLFD